MRNYGILLICFLSLISCKPKQNLEEASWQIKTVTELWNHHPGHVRSLFEAIDLDQEGMKQVQESLTSGDTIQAAESIIEYYKNIDRDWIVLTLDDINYKDALAQAQALVNDSLIREGHQYYIPTDSDDSWQWDYTGPDKDDEFGYGLNGHKYLPSLYIAAQKTGESRFIEKYDQIIRDWIIHHPFPSNEDSVHMVWDPAIPLDYRDIGEVEWRTLETGHRLGASWPQTFYALQKNEDFTPATRLLMLSCIALQADFLSQKHKFGHNWTTMEMNGLALAGLSFPEFKNAPKWADYAKSVMKNEINRQVYPDGLQTEISSKTQWVALNRFETLASNFSKAGIEMPREYLDKVELMYDYLAYSMRPDGHQPLNNDSDRDDLKPIILKAAKKFQRPDWEWIASNGNTGKPPSKNFSITFPWAGIHIMRNGWQRDADWSFFDTGPYGTGHQHRDKLHLSINAFGKDMLVDGGRYTHKDYFNFDPAFWRGYFRSSYSHNVILVDGNGQKEGLLRTETPLIEDQDYIHTPIYDYAYGTFEAGFENIEGNITHSRSVLYVKGKYWLVLDHIATDRPRKIEALWHYAPDNTVSLNGIESTSTNESEPNLRIIPAGNIPWEVEIIEGQEKPVIQGWYSSVFGEKVTNPTVVYTSKITKSSTFAWVMIPSKGLSNKAEVEMKKDNKLVHITLRLPNEDQVNITLPLEKNPSKVKFRF